MKFNWGTGIFLSFLIFALAIAYIIVFPFNQKVDLVADDYYEKELKYQEQIDRVERTHNLNEELTITKDGLYVNFQFPKSASDITGEIFFYRPSDAGKDIIREIKTDAANHQTIDVSGFDHGLWKVKVRWNMNKQSYYFEKIIMN